MVNSKHLKKPLKIYTFIISVGSLNALANFSQLTETCEYDCRHNISSQPEAIELRVLFACLHELFLANIIVASNKLEIKIILPS